MADRAHCAGVYDKHMAIYYANAAISLVEVESLRPGMLRNAVPTDKAWYAEHIKDVFDIDGKWEAGCNLHVFYAWLFIREKGFPPGALGIIEIRATI